MRSVFLPDSFAGQEVAKSWETGRTFTILIAWLVIGIFFSVRKFKWVMEFWSLHLHLMGLKAQPLPALPMI